MATKAPKPTARERAAQRVCPNCGRPSPARRSPRGPAPLYCDKRCKQQMGNRQLADGLALVPYLKAWRVDRGSGPIAQESFSRICQIVDELNEADRTAGRPRADYYAAVLIDSDAPTVNELRYGRQKVAQARAREAAENPQPEAPPAPASTPEQEPDLATILQQIAAGHNDARGLAEAALARFGK